MCADPKSAKRQLHCQSFCASGICVCKRCSKNIVKIDTQSYFYQPICAQQWCEHRTNRTEVLIYFIKFFAKSLTAEISCYFLIFILFHNNLFAKVCSKSLGQLIAVLDKKQHTNVGKLTSEAINFKLSTSKRTFNLIKSLFCCQVLSIRR